MRHLFAILVTLSAVGALALALTHPKILAVIAGVLFVGIIYAEALANSPWGRGDD